MDPKTEPMLWLTRFENTTTGFSLLGSKNSQELLKVSGILQNGMTLLLPLNSCPVGHLVVIDIHARIHEKAYEMQATGRVVQSEKSEQTQLVEVEFKSYDQKLWGKLIRFIGNKQLHADELFRSIKGEK